MTSGKKHVAAILTCAVIAMASRGVWFNLVGYSPAFVGEGIETLASVGRFGYMASSAVFMIVFALLGRHTIGIRTLLFPLAPTLMLMGTGMFGLATGQSLISPEGMLMIGGVLMGIGNAWGTLCAYYILGSVGSLWQVVLCCAISGSISAAASASLQELGTAGDQVSAALAMVVVTLISLFVAFRLFEKTGETSAVFPQNDDSLPLGVKEQAHKAVGSMIAHRTQTLQLAIITVAMIALRGSSNGGVWGDQRINGSMFAGAPLLMIALFLAVSLISFWVFFKNPSKSRYHIPLLVLIGCFLMLALAGGSLEGPIRSTMNSAIELFCQLIFSFAVVDSMRKMPSAGVMIPGFATGFSWVLALFWMVFLESIAPAANIAIVVVAYLLIVLVASPNATSSAKGASDEASHNEDDSTDGANPFDGVIAQCRALSGEYRLTKREGEILELLAQGRSVPYICKELVLAEGTVRTHMTRIYKKLDIHSKQELFDLLMQR